MSEVKWIKIMVDVFNNKKIKQIEAMPDADAILVIWFKLLCLSGNINENGLIVLTKDIAYTDEMLATEFRKPITTIRLALGTFSEFGMVEIVNDIYRISNWERYQNIDKLNEIREYNRLAKQKERALKKEMLLLGSNVNDKSMTSQQCQDIDIDIEVDKDIKDKESMAAETPAASLPSKPSKPSKPLKTKYGTYGWVKLTDAEYQRLLSEFGKDRLDYFINYIDESAQRTSNKNKWSDWNLVIRKAIRENWGKYAGGPTKKKAPKSEYSAIYDEIL